MKTLLKNLVPESLLYLAVAVDFLGRTVLFLSGCLAWASVSLHILLETPKGVKYKEIKKKMKEANELIMKVQSQILAAQQQQSANNGDARLATLMKPQQPVNQTGENIIQLEKKRDEPTES